ncbi:MAG: tetratricopeptide repeat protein [Candidatus Methanomethylophilaceae archaeon]|nr:tetratricopeptide repeat protein [Candidatus Methanomethylophilaceae archaeon]
MTSDPAYEAVSKAKRQEESGNPKGAVQTLEDYLRTDPHNNKVRLELARIIIYKLNDLDYGMMQLDAILDIDPENADALAASATVLSKYKKHNKETQEKLDHLMKVRPDANTYDLYAKFLKFQKGDFKAAAEMYRKAIELEPTRYEFHQNYSVLLLNDLKDYQAAKEELEVMLSMKPNDPKVKMAYDRLLREKFDKQGNPRKSRFGLFRRP